MKGDRIKKVNSLLKEVISEVIKNDVNHPKVSQFITVTKVDVTKNLHAANVYISVIDKKEEEETLKALIQSAGFISSTASKKVNLRYFPTLTFKLDTSLDKFLKIEKVLEEIKKKND